jgi:N-acetylmuramoyl-L-alanine amidase CwlA
MIKIIKHTSKHNTSYLANRPHTYIVIHYTAGTTSKSGTALNNAKYFEATDIKVSADFIVDDTTIVQYNPDLNNRYTWAVGGSKYSSMTTSLGGKFYGKCVHKNCINIEMCSSKTNKSSLKITDKDWYLTDGVIDNTVELTKYLMELYNIDIDHVIMHHHVTGKVCPQPWVYSEAALKGWNDFLNKVKGVTKKEETTKEEISYPELPFAITVSSNNIIYREAAKSSSKALGKTGKGVFTIDKLSGNWGHLKSGAGWVYLIKDDLTVNIPAPKKVPYLIQLSDSVKSIYIRETPNSSAKITGTITNKSKYTIIEEKNGWGKLKSGAGWIYLKNTKEVK